MRFDSQRSASAVAARDRWFDGPVAVASAAACEGSVTEVLQLLGALPLEAPPIDATIMSAVRIPIRRVRGGATLVEAGAPATMLYAVRYGSFKCLRIAEDGYEQVLGFSGQRDVLGFDGLCSGRYPSTFVALEDAAAYALRFDELDRLRRRIEPLDRALQKALSAQLSNAAGIADVMAAVAAEVRLARFLLQRAACMAACGQSSFRLRLTMSRRDIASHLGVAHETVSRSFGELVDWGYLRVDHREVEIVDAAALKSLAGSTRGPLDDRLRGLGRQAAACGHGASSRHRAN